MKPDYDTPIRPGGQTYNEYLETMKAYRFNPDSYESWAVWQHYHEKRNPGGALKRG